MRAPRLLGATLLVALVSGCAITAPTPLPSPTPSASELPWEPLLATDGDAGTGEISFSAPESFRGNFTFTLLPDRWTAIPSATTTTYRSFRSECVTSAHATAIPDARSGLNDADGSAHLLDELTGGVSLEEARRGVWLSEPAFDIAHAVFETDTTVSYRAARVFSALGIEHVIQLDCSSRGGFREAYPELRASGHVTASLTPGAPATAEIIGHFHVHLPVDLGPGPHAMGTVDLDSDGHPARYTVAADDEWGHIATRFGLYAVPTAHGGIAEGLHHFTGYLTTINQVRRGESPWTLYVGDTVNLSAFTVTSVGQINGTSTSRPAPDPLPPQR